MNRYEVWFKNDTYTVIESKWMDITTIHSMLCDHQPFIQIGNKILAKDFIEYIKKIETTEE